MRWLKFSPGITVCPARTTGLPTATTAILEPDADGTLHLPVPEGWGKTPIRVKAELEPLASTVSSIEPVALYPAEATAR